MRMGRQGPGRGLGQRFRAQKKIVIPTVVIAVLAVALFFLPNRFHNPVYDNFETVRAEVLAVDNTYVVRAGVVLTGQQVCQVRLLGGQRRGDVVQAVNMLEGKLERDKMFVEADQALVLMSKTGTGEAGFEKATLVDYYRFPYQLVLLAVFVLLLVGFAGWLGLRAILSFAFTLLAIFKLHLPLLLVGVDPILSSVFITALTLTVIILLVYGITREFAAATLGTLAGIVFTAVLALVFTSLFRIHGAVMPNSESLLYAGYTNLDLTRVFIGSIFLSASGALTDVAVDITSAMKEVLEKRPDLTRGQLIRSGIYVGRNAIGTMTTTLLLAYTGGYIGLLLVFVGQGTPLPYILNLNTIAAEILNTFIGSIGLITAAPFTAVIAGFMLTRRRRA